MLSAKRLLAQNFERHNAVHWPYVVLPVTGTSQSFTGLPTGFPLPTHQPFQAKHFM